MLFDLVYDGGGGSGSRLARLSDVDLWFSAVRPCLLDLRQRFKSAVASHKPDSQWSVEVNCTYNACAWKCPTISSHSARHMSDQNLIDVH